MRQIRFGTARALTDAAFEVREAVVESLPIHFTLRNTYTARGFKVEKATRTNLQAEVGTDREYLVHHVIGGRQRRAAVPSSRIRRRPTQVVRRRRWPGALDPRTHFMRREGRGRTLYRRLRRSIRKVWRVPDRQDVKPRWNFEGVARRTFRPALERALPRQLDRAFASAR